MEDINVIEQDLAHRDITKTGGELLTFFVEGQTYGLEIQYVTDIIEIQPITVIPKIPKYIEGVINLRGKVIPVMNVRSRFGKDHIDYDERTCIIVVEMDDISVGLIVDRVSEVISVLASQLTPPPNNKTVNANKYIKHLVNTDDDVIFILDSNKIIID